MIAQPLVEVTCAVCGGDEHRTVCPAPEVRAHLEYLRRFHRRRLRPAPDGRLPDEALEDRSDFTQDYATDIVECTGCGLVFRNPRPTAAAIARAYSGDTYGFDRLESLFDAQVELYRPRARRLRRWLGAGRDVRVVEVGSFVGGFLAAGREHGWDMLGVDPGQEVGEFCARKRLPVFSGTLANAPVAPGSADCVAIWNTFDQLPDPEPTLTAARRLLRPGGLLALRVPNGDCFKRLSPLLSNPTPTPTPTPTHNRNHTLTLNLNLHSQINPAHHRSSPITNPRSRIANLRGLLRAAAAWNNLLAFPYLHGYSVRTLDWLLAWHGFERVTADPDTLPRLADAQTRRWAAWEERLLKWAWRWIARADRLRSEHLTLAPWFDAYHELRQ